MSCPDWSRLAAVRDEEPESWAEGLEHFDACPSCRPEALKADPLLVFRRLPAAEMSPAEEQSEIDAVRQAVSAMRTASRLESRGRFAGWRRWAAAAVLAVASLAVSQDRLPIAAEEPEAQPAPAAQVASAPRPARDAAATPAPRGLAAAAQGSPDLENLNRPNARVYHMESPDVKVTWVVDEKMDV